MPPKLAKVAKPAAPVARAPAAKPAAPVARAPVAKPPPPVPGAAAAASASAASAAPPANRLHNVAASAAGAGVAQRRNPRAAKQPAIKPAAPAVASASASSAPAAHANLFQDPGKRWESGALHNQQPWSADPKRKAYHHKMPRPDLAHVPKMLSPAGQSSLLNIVTLDALSQRRGAAAAGGNLPAPGKMLASFSGNLALGPLPKDRAGDPGSGFDPNLAAGGLDTPRTAQMRTVHDLTKTARARAHPQYTPHEESQVIAAFQNVHNLQQQRADPRVDGPVWDNVAGGYVKRAQP